MPSASGLRSTPRHNQTLQRPRAGVPVLVIRDVVVRLPGR